MTPSIPGALLLKTANLKYSVVKVHVVIRR